MRWLPAVIVIAGLLGGCASAQTRAEHAEAARINTQLGIDYAQRDQLSLALEKLQRALGYDDSLPATHTAIAYVYERQGERALAEKHYRKALRLDDEDPALKNNFGVFICGQGRASEAESYFLQAATNPRYETPAAAWLNAGRCLRDIDLDKADTYLRESLKYDPQSREALGQLAIVNFRKGEYLSTRAFVQRYDLSKDATAELLYVAEQTEIALGDDGAAAAYRRRLEREFPDFNASVTDPRTPK